MNIVQSFIIAISMYSKIPMPGVEWNKKNMRYAMCFFPVIGMIIGAVMYGIGQILYGMAASPLLRGAAFTLIPILISGGIHMDGFMDTMDALASYGDQEKKLQILKDSHAGAFAILGLGCYLVWSVAVWSEIPKEMLGSCCICYMISRGLSGLSVVTFTAARESGLLKTFQDGAQKRAVKISMAGYLILGCVCGMLLNVKGAICMILGAAISFIHYKRVCSRQFGGVTGDLAGYFLEISELIMVTAIWGGGLWR